MTTILSVPTMRPLSLIASLFFVEHFNGLQEGSFFFTRRVDGEVDIHDVEIDLFDTHGASFLLLCFLGQSGNEAADLVCTLGQCVAVVFLFRRSGCQILLCRSSLSLPT